MKGLVLFIMFFFTLGSVTSAHPVHVSVCNIELTRNESVISVKLFSDDFSTLLHNKYNEEFILSKADENPYREYIINYISSHLKITLNRNKTLMFKYDYSEVNEGAIWLYFKVDKLNSVDKISVFNTLMLDLYDDQTNLLIINNDGKQIGFRFNNQVRELEIDLK